MLLVWNEPKPSPSSVGKAFCLPYPDIFFDRPILGWLQYHGIFWGGKDYKIAYNYLYHFFDIHVYDNARNGDPRKTFRDYLLTTHLDWQEHGTYRMEGETQVQGSRFWIQAEDFPNNKRFMH